MDGKFSDKSYLNYTGTLGSQNNITEFTLCQRFNINFLRGVMTTMASYTSDINDNAIITWINRDDQNILAPLELKSCKYPLDVQECTKINLEVKPFMNWIHYCLTIKSVKISEKEMVTNAKLYLDGNLVNQGKKISKYK